MTKNVFDAEDLMQDAFIQIFRGIRSFRGDAAFSPWIYRVVVNTVLMTRRKRHLREVSIDEPTSVDSSPLQGEFGGDDREFMGAVDREVGAPELPLSATRGERLPKSEFRRRWTQCLTGHRAPALVPAFRLGRRRSFLFWSEMYLTIRAEILFHNPSLSVLLCPGDIPG
jgi:RNA polymerase sigma factor (sigma-70 family)